MTTLIRWEPFREAAAVHNELSRLMNGLYEGNGRSTQTWLPGRDKGTQTPDKQFSYAVHGAGSNPDPSTVTTQPSPARRRRRTTRRRRCRRTSRAWCRRSTTRSSR